MWFYDSEALKRNLRVVCLDGRRYLKTDARLLVRYQGWCSRENKRPGSEANQSPSSGVQLQSALCYTSSSSTALTAWFCINNVTNVPFIWSLSTAADKECPGGHSKRQSYHARKKERYPAGVIQTEEILHSYKHEVRQTAGLNRQLTEFTMLLVP